MYTPGEQIYLKMDKIIKVEIMQKVESGKFSPDH